MTKCPQSKMAARLARPSASHQPTCRINATASPRPSAAAEVTVGGTRDQASNAGFRLLAGYIFGGNQGRWGLATSPDFTTWTMATRTQFPYYTPEVFFPPGVRHGSVLPITAAEADAITAGFGVTLYDLEGKAH